MDRMFRIHQTLQSGAYPNSRTLARQFEVHQKTIKRDIDFMRTRMDLPIEFDTQRNGYYYTRPVDQLPQLPMSESEVFALLVAHKAIAQYRGTPFEQPLQLAFARLTGQLDRTLSFSLGHLEEMFSFRPLAPGDTDLATFEVLANTLRERHSVVFTYRNRGQQKFQRRDVNPYHLACIQNQWYLLAYDEQRKDIRTFALARIRDAVPGERRYQIPSSFRVADYLKGSFGVYKGGEDYEVVLEFDAWAADEVRGRQWHHSQEMQDLPQGGLRLRMRLNNLEEVERWALSLGEHVRVMRPQVLAERLVKAARLTMERYGSGRSN